MNDNWLVVNTKSNSEKKAFENLKRQNFNVFFPKIKEDFFGNSHQRIITKPLFPGYLFVQFQNQLNWSKINNTYGVLKIVKFGEMPIFLSKKILLGLKKRCDQNDFFLKKSFLKKGDKINIKKSCSSAIEAIFEERIDSRRSIILLNILNREFKISVKNRFIKTVI
tara:strand:- start:206 stop:703 length:498 start_codon:yes stop_codon:yes gene_type:complete